MSPRPVLNGITYYVGTCTGTVCGVLCTSSIDAQIDYQYSCWWCMATVLIDGLYCYCYCYCYSQGRSSVLSTVGPVVKSGTVFLLYSVLPQLSVCRNCSRSFQGSWMNQRQAEAVAVWGIFGFDCVLLY